MLKPSHKARADQLGMPFGTAQNKLRKLVMFSLVQRLGEDTCFQCGRKIETAEELSIEHKTPWLHDHPDLFWSLDNIAFSHRVCNRPAKYLGRLPKAAPPGTSWCSGCQTFLEVEHFNRNRTTWNGCHKYCRPCQSARNRKKPSALKSIP